MNQSDELEEVWRKRLGVAKGVLDFAHSQIEEIGQDITEGGLSPADGNHGLKIAIDLESLALAEHHRVLRIYCGGPLG